MLVIAGAVREARESAPARGCERRLGCGEEAVQRPGMKLAGKQTILRCLQGAARPRRRSHAARSSAPCSKPSASLQALIRGAVAASLYIAAAMAKQRPRRGGPAKRAARDEPELPSDMEVRPKRCTCRM